MTSGIEKSAGGDTESSGQPLDNKDCGIARPALEVADVGPVESDLECKRLLREAALASERPQIRGETMANVHEPTLAEVSPSSLQTISDTIHLN